MSQVKSIKPIFAPHTYHGLAAKYHLVTKDVLMVALKNTLAGVMVAVGISLALQIVYPSSMALPQTRIGGEDYGFKSKAQIAASIAATQERKLLVTSGSHTLEYTPKELGITFLNTEDAQRAVAYSWRERLMPFSFFFERRDVPHYSFTVDEVKARQFAATLQQYNESPIDAKVSLEGVRVVITKQQEGYSYDIDRLVQEVKRLQITSDMQIVLEPTSVQPAITDQAAIEAAGVLQRRLQQPVTVQASGKRVTADAALLASWVVFMPDAQNKKLLVNYDKGKIKQWLAGLAGEVYRPGTPRTVTMLDGAVVNEANAADGLALNVDATAEAVIAGALAKQTTVEGVTAPVTVAARAIRNYTRSSKGLQALLDYWDASNAGTWGIVLKTMDGKVSASLNPNRQFTTASVYKIYVAYVVYTKTDSGELSVSTPTDNGNTVSGCLELMIVRSDNACGHALGDMIGWSASDDMLRGKGFDSTTLEYGAHLTTAQDAAEYLTQLENGSLLSADNRTALLDKMSRNIYRYAIPAGSPGVRSANKLGALGAYNHDVAIVYHPKGTYVLLVFSYGSSHARIRELAREVSQVMNQ